MKKRRYLKLVFVVTLILMLSCNKDDNESDNSLEGIWNVIGLQGSLAQPVTYNKGEITWLFNFKNNTLTIKNTVDNQVGIQPLFSQNHTGVYNFSMTTENDNTILIVENRRGILVKEGDKITIDYGIAFDDIAYTLVR